jgi:site-specific DNA-methyltransferase (adenine-specific)
VSDPTRLIHGEALAVLRTLPDASVDAVVTDPPYNVGVRYGDYNDRREDFVAWIAEVITECRRVSSGVVCLTMASTRVYDLPRPDWLAVWHKPWTAGYWNTPLIPHWEAVCLYDCPPRRLPIGDVFTSNPAPKKDGEGHPTPKPVPLFAEFVRLFSLPGGTVLDPFMGSGTTGIACVGEGRRFIGVEQDANYFAIARRRIGEAEAYRDGVGGELFAHLGGKP